MNFYIEGFKTFFKIGLFTLGGGYAMIPLMESEIVERRKWITKEEFLDILAVAQSLPGVFAVNFSIYVGHKTKGFKGSVALAAGTVLPSFLIILLIALFFSNFSENRVVEAIFKGIRPAVVALIALPCIKLARTAHITWSNSCFPILTAMLICLYGFSPVYIILAVIVCGYLYSKYNTQNN